MEVSGTAQLLSHILPLSFCFSLPVSSITCLCTHHHTVVSSSPSHRTPPTCPSLFTPLFAPLPPSLIPSPSRPFAHFLSKDALVVTHLRLRTDTPLILMFCNLQRGRKSCSTCVTVMKLHRSIHYIQAFPLLSEVAVSCYLFSLRFRMHYSGGMGEKQRRGKVIGPPRRLQVTGTSTQGRKETCSNLDKLFRRCEIVTSSFS